MKRISGAKPGPFSLIAADVVIRGDIVATADLHVDGRVEGDIHCAGLVQGKGSSIAGRIEAKSVRLAGRVDGGIEAGELVIEASARIFGDISYDSISIAPGAHVDGRFTCRIAQDGAPEIKLIGSEVETAA